MTFLVGVDEAGYGPNLGPLVISVAVWRVPDDACDTDLYKLLERAVVRAKEPTRNGRPCSRPRGAPQRVTIADSKLVYSPAVGLGELEANLFAVLGLLGPLPTCWDELWRLLATASLVERDSAPWHAGFEVPLPCAADPELVRPRAELLEEVCRDAGVRLVSLASRAVFPERFNELAADADSKGAALSELTIDLLGDVLDAITANGAGGRCHVVCDKHGGRNRYAPHLQRRFPDVLVRIHGESREESIYRFELESLPIEVRFTARGERHLPTALASMASKYLREVSMLAFNDFWCARVPELRPTAGYPQDARRFKREIAAAQASLGISDAVLWRAR